MKQLQTNLKQTRAVSRKTQKNFRRPITNTPSLRSYLIDGERRLVWVFRDESNNIRITIADSRVPLSEQAKAMFNKGYYTKIAQRAGNVQYRKIPKRIKKMFAGMSRDDIEWAFAMDFEPDYDYPEEVKMVHGNNDSVASYRMGDVEIRGHSHPGNDGIYSLPSMRDVSLTSYKKPELVVWTNPRTGRDVWIYVTSNKEPFLNNAEQESREKELQTIWNDTQAKILKEHPARAEYVDCQTGEKGREVYAESTTWFRDELNRRLNEVGYNFEIVDPSRTPVITSRDKRNDMERSAGGKTRHGEYNPKAVQQIFNKYGKQLHGNFSKASALIEIEDYARKTGNTTIVNIVTGSNDKASVLNEPGHVLDDRLLRVKSYIDTGRVAKVTREATGVLPIEDTLTIDIDNVQKVQKRIDKEKRSKAPGYQSPQPGDIMEIQPEKIDKMVSFQGQQYEVEKLSYATSKDGIAVGVKARLPDDQGQSPTSKGRGKSKPTQASSTDVQNVRRLLKWKRIKKDKALSGSLETVIKDAKAD